MKPAHSHRDREHKQLFGKTDIKKSVSLSLIDRNMFSQERESLIEYDKQAAGFLELEEELRSDCGLYVGSGLNLNLFRHECLKPASFNGQQGREKPDCIKPEEELMRVLHVFHFCAVSSHSFRSLHTACCQCSQMII